MKNYPDISYICDIVTGNPILKSVTYYAIDEAYIGGDKICAYFDLQFQGYPRFVFRVACWYNLETREFDNYCEGRGIIFNNEIIIGQGIYRNIVGKWFTSYVKSNTDRITNEAFVLQDLVEEDIEAAGGFDI